MVPDQETCLLKTQTLFLPSHPQMDFTGLFPWPTFFPYCVQGKCRSGRRGSAEETTCSSIASLKLSYSNFKSATQACVCNAVLGFLCLDFIIIVVTTFLSSPLNLKVSANSVAEV